VLIENTLFGVRDKVQIAIDRIRQFEPPEGYYVAFSGGKDSCVVLDLVKRAGVKYDAHYNLTTVDPPELVYFIREHHADVEVHTPKETMWQLIERKADVPTRGVRWCCSILKEGGGNGRTVITGVRWAESARRSKRKMVEFCSGKGKSFLQPVIDWSDDDVWEYIHTNDLPYCSLYDEGFKRIGCILCPMTTNHDKAFERFPKIADAYKRSMNKAFTIMAERKKRNGAKLIWKNGDDWFKWWISKPTRKVDPDQTVIFE